LLVSRLLAALRSDAQPEPFRWRGLVGIAAVAACAFVARGHFHTEALTDCYVRAWVPPMVVALPYSARAPCFRERPWRDLLLVAWPISLLIANHRVNP